MKKKLRLLLAVPVLFLVAVLVIAGVRSRVASSGDPRAGSGGSSADVAAGSKAAPAELGETSRGVDGAVASSGSKGVDKQTVATGPMTRAVISTGQVTLSTASIDKARAEVIRLVVSWGGTVADEQSSSDTRGRIVDSTLTLRVPSSKFDEALTSFSRLGKVEQQSRKSEDVTTQVIDNGARVRAAERSIRQIETLLDRATQLSDIIAIESDLARRQADLDSLKSQQAYLADQTSLSTINVYLSRTGHLRADPQEARGFLAGLGGGWAALKAATVVLLTVVGAVLPFALVLLVLGVPLWLVVRRRLAALSAGSAPARSA
ncbi:MAG: hypothetical protein JWR90_4253 [Marmoricola sp.]|jgi:hypothetical protein|nr:hypothetical protein [Marmoricola sp.]